MKRPSNGVELVSNYTYRRLRIIGVKISSRLDDLLGVLLKLCLTLVQDGLPALLLSLSTLDKPDNPSLLCLFANGEIRRDFSFSEKIVGWLRQKSSANLRSK